LGFALRFLASGYWFVTNLKKPTFFGVDKPSSFGFLLRFQAYYRYLYLLRTYPLVRSIQHGLLCVSCHFTPSDLQNLTFFGFWYWTFHSNSKSIPSLSSQKRLVEWQCYDKWQRWVEAQQRKEQSSCNGGDGNRIYGSYLKNSGDVNNRLFFQGMNGLRLPLFLSQFSTKFYVGWAFPIQERYTFYWNYGNTQILDWNNEKLTATMLAASSPAFYIFLSQEMQRVYGQEQGLICSDAPRWQNVDTPFWQQPEDNLKIGAYVDFVTKQLWTIGTSEVPMICSHDEGKKSGTISSDMLEYIKLGSV
jgi:hypothetical protein